MARKLTKAEIDTLMQNGCSSSDWNRIAVTDGFLPERVRNAIFDGDVFLGRNTGTLKVDGTEYPCGISQALLSDVHVGDNVLIRNIGTHISGYQIEENAVIMNVAGLATDAETTFGQGLKVEALNEAGGREVMLSENLTAQMAYILAVYRYKSRAVTALEALLTAEISKLKGRKGVVGKGARVMNCGSIFNVRIGAYAQVSGASSLKEGTIASCEEDPAVIGSGVSAEGFVILAGGHVTTQALLSKVFVGQGARIGKQFSAENSLFFANCEGFHGEACSIYAGPYTVTHHKSTLLIAAQYSFYNAGSGTNHSNHMYKLGPVHQGILERGCKTGSFSYLLLEAHLAPFCVVIGKHMSNINIPDMPFSYVSESGGKSYLTPAMNLITVGTVRDQEKWATRDRRKVKAKTDLLNPAVYSPYTIEKMIRGRDILQKLYAETPKDVEYLNYGGTILSRLLLKNGAKYYDMTIKRYLYQHAFVKIGSALDKGLNWQQALGTLGASQEADTEWVDASGLLCTKRSLMQQINNLENGRYQTISQFQSALVQLHDAYAEAEWAYVSKRFGNEIGVSLCELTKQKALEQIEEWRILSRKMSNMTLADAEKEFEDFAKISYGMDGTEADAAQDFKVVRGQKETNKVIVRMTNEMERFFVGLDQLVEKINKA